MYRVPFSQVSLKVVMSVYLSVCLSPLLPSHTLFNQTLTSSKHFWPSYIFTGSKSPTKWLTRVPSRWSLNPPNPHLWLIAGLKFNLFVDMSSEYLSVIHFWKAPTMCFQLGSITWSHFERLSGLPYAGYISYPCPFNYQSKNLNILNNLPNLHINSVILLTTPLAFTYNKF